MRKQKGDKKAITLSQFPALFVRQLITDTYDFSILLM